MIALINYGMGNLHSVEKALEYVGFKVRVTSNPKEIIKFEGVVLPGVGAFKEAISNLRRLRIDEAIYRILEEERPFLGICLGLQLLFSKSFEDGEHDGLDILKGRVVKFPEKLLIPHIGWNTIKINYKIPETENIFKEIPDSSYFYFVHSYFVEPEEKDIVATSTEYGIGFTSSIFKKNILATQFHPEKSQDIGLKFLKNFKEFYFENS
jgi:glutamine amidotransferase